EPSWATIDPSAGLIYFVNESCSQYCYSLYAWSVSSHTIVNHVQLLGTSLEAAPFYVAATNSVYVDYGGTYLETVNPTTFVISDIQISPVHAGCGGLPPVYGCGLVYDPGSGTLYAVSAYGTVFAIPPGGGSPIGISGL